MASTEDALSPTDVQPSGDDRDAIEPLPTTDHANLRGRKARVSNRNAKRTKKNFPATTAGSSVPPHDEASSHSDDASGQVKKKPRRTSVERRAADRRYQQTARQKKAEFDAMFAPIDTNYNTFGLMPGKSSEETKKLLEFRQLLCDSVERSKEAPPTRCMIGKEGISAITTCRSVMGVQDALIKHRITTITPELMFVPAIASTSGSAEQLLPTMLNTNFNAIYQDASKTFKPIWSISEQLKKMKGQDGDAHQPASARPGQASTKKFKNRSREQAFNNLKDVRRDIDYGVNILDIANSSGRIFTPHEVRDVDILHIIHDKQTRQSSYSRDAALTQGRQHGLSIKLVPEWMILSMHGAVSPWHADSAGYCTFVVGIEGCKAWHFVKGDWSETKVEFGIYGTYHTNWSAGVYSVPIDPGCSL